MGLKDSCPGPDERQIDWASENVITNCDLQNSTYAISYVATVAGLYDVKITRDDVGTPQHIKGACEGRTDGVCGFILVVLPSVTNVSRTSTDLSLASEPGAESARAGEPYNFTVQARDRYGNKRITGGDVVRANSWYMGAKRKQLCSQRESAAVCWPQRYTTEGFYSCTRQGATQPDRRQYTAR